MNLSYAESAQFVSNTLEKSILLRGFLKLFIFASLNYIYVVFPDVCTLLPCCMMLNMT